MKKLRLGMVGGGQGAFIGAVHRIAARLDDQWELVAGALSSDPDRARASGAELGLDPDRVYVDYEQMARAEAARARWHRRGGHCDSEPFACRSCHLLSRIRNSRDLRQTSGLQYGNGRSDCRGRAA